MDQLQTCDRCGARMYLTRKIPHPTLWPSKVLANYECPKCGRLRECTEDGDVECESFDPA
jgi:predicted nucleic-acid-binding Zn-ribbon protein